MTNHLPGLRSGGHGASSASSSGAMLQFGLAPVPLGLRQCTKDIFEDFTQSMSLTCMTKSHMQEFGNNQSVVQVTSRIAQKSPAVLVLPLAALRRYKIRQSWKSGTAASDLLSQQTRLCIFCWNPVPIGAIENHFGALWQVVALRQSIEFLDNDASTNQCHVAHFRGCSTLSNKDFLEADLQDTYPRKRSVAVAVSLPRSAFGAVPGTGNRPS